MMMCGRWLIIVLISGLLVSCTDTEPKDMYDSEALYGSYNFWGEEGKELITAVFQFHTLDEEGPVRILKEPSKVYLDDVLLLPDSGRVSGVFYEIQIPIKEFAGTHTIRFVDRNNKEHTETFSFAPFGLVRDLRDTIKRQHLILNLKGLKEKDVLRVVMMDTVFESEGVNQLDTVHNNQLDLRKFLGAINNGPISLHLYKEENQSVDKKSYGMGKISITYALKREFELKD